jgi:3-keto-5-aminohexanoate cleavage enzyme
MEELGIAPELEAFDTGMINYAAYLAKKGLISPPYYFNLILGNIACAQADLLHAGIMIKDLPEGSLWSLAGIGSSQLMMNSLAIAMGGGVRVGLEDNIFFDRQRTMPARNIDLLKRVHTIAAANERPIMSSRELRELLHLEKGNGQYGRNPNTQE